mgnify:CR=1 FL=1
MSDPVTSALLAIAAVAALIALLALRRVGPLRRELVASQSETVFAVNLEFTQHRLTRCIPVNNPLTTVNQTFVIQLDKLFANCFG